MPAIRKNREREKSHTYYMEMLTSTIASKGDTGYTKSSTDHMENILDIR